MLSELSTTPLPPPSPTPSALVSSVKEKSQNMNPSLVQTTTTTPASTPTFRTSSNNNNNNNNSSTNNNNNNHNNNSNKNNPNTTTSENYPKISGGGGGCGGGGGVGVGGSIAGVGVGTGDPFKKMITTMTKKKKKTKNFHDILLETLDIILSCLVVAPCVIAYWRGTWELMGALIFPDNTPLSATISFLIGGLGHLIFTLTQKFFKDYIHPDKRRLTYYIVSRCYTAVFGVVCVNMWRGSWVLCDWLTSVDSLMIICVVTLVAIMFLVATRTVRNLGAAPYTVTMDHKSDYFEVDTMFKIPGFHQPALYVLDTLFSVFVIGTLVVIAWRGLWGIMDLTLYPKQKAKSALASMIIGYITVFFTFAIQPLIRIICKHIRGLFKLVVCDIFYFFTFFGAVNAWRGIWNLLDVYLYPDNPILSYWLTHVIPFLILAALKCANSILIRGVFIDAEGPGGECVEIPINYVRLHFERERNKKYFRDHHLDKNIEKEAQSILIEKPLKVESKSTPIQARTVPAYDNTQFVV